MGIEWIEHNGKKMLYVDFSHLQIDEKLKIIEEALKISRTYDGEKLLLLINSTDSVTTQEIFEKEKHILDSVRFTTIAALVGLNTAKKTILKIFSKTIPILKRVQCFDSVDEAKDWLATQ